MKKVSVGVFILLALVIQIANNLSPAIQPFETIIDSRLTWIKVTNAQTFPRYQITNIGYRDGKESGGNVNVYVEVLDEFGRNTFGARVRFNTTDGQNEAIQTTINGTTDFPQSNNSCFFPDRGESGPYYVEIAGVASDRVTGMGLPVCYHVNYIIRFQRVVNGVPPITLTPVPITPSPTNYITRDEWNSALDKIILSLQGLRK